MIFSSRELRVRNTWAVRSSRFTLMSASAGETWAPDLLDAVAEVGISFLANRCLQRDRRPRDLEHLANLSLGNVHLLGYLRRCRFAAQSLDQLPRDAESAC
jgi:hypothetical protein